MKQQKPNYEMKQQKPKNGETKKEINKLCGNNFCDLNFSN